MERTVLPGSTKLYEDTVLLFGNITDTVIHHRCLYVCRCETRLHMYLNMCTMVDIYVHRVPCVTYQLLLRHNRSLGLSVSVTS